MNNDINEQELIEEQIDEEEQKIFYEKLNPSLEDTLLEFNMYGDEDDR